jgi:hypothetical protein
MVSKCWRACLLGVNGAAMTLLHRYIANGQSLSPLWHVSSPDKEGRTSTTTGLMMDENIEVLLLH